MLKSDTPGHTGGLLRPCDEPGAEQAASGRHVEKGVTLTSFAGGTSAATTAPGAVASADDAPGSGRYAVVYFGVD